MGVVTDSNALKAFRNESIMAVLPPRSAHSFTMAFRASDDLFIASLSILLTEVHNSRASSKSPITVRHVSVQPEPSASFRVSIN